MKLSTDHATQARVVAAVKDDAFGFILDHCKCGGATLRWLNEDSAVVSVQARMGDVKIIAVTYSWRPNSTTMLRGTNAMLAQSIADAVRSHNHGLPTLFTGAQSPDNKSFTLSNLTKQNNGPIW